MTDLFILYTAYMNNAFGNNEFLIGLVTAGILGSITYLAKSIPNQLYQLFLKHATTTTYVDSSNEAYFGIMQNLHATGITKSSRFLSILSGAWGYGPPQLQLGNGTQIIWFNNTFCLVGISMETTQAKIIHKLHIRTLGRSHSTARKLLALSAYTEEPNETLLVDISKDTRRYQPKESMESRVSSKEELEVFSCIKDFISKKDWYKEKNLPYKLGIILAGPPGAGKTSFVRAIAGDLGYDICILHTFSDFHKIPTGRKCIVLIDEVDSAVSKRSDGSSTSKGQESMFEDYLVTTALQAMDGVSTKEGMIVIGTTNNPEKIDPAMKRHGRFGITKTFSYATPAMFEAVVKKYYEKEVSVESIIQCTSADLQGKFCEGLSLDEYLEHFTQKRN